MLLNKSIQRMMILCLITLLVLTSCNQNRETNKQSTDPIKLTISAASSLTDALTEIKRTFESSQTSIELSFNFGASGALQQQIEQGAPVDLFLSASSKNMQSLLDQEIIDSVNLRTLLSNELVVVIPKTRKRTIDQMTDLGKSEIRNLAIGIPETVPAGSYAKQALSNSGLWETLQDKTVQGKDVRQVLQYVETGNVDAAFVYKTDAMTSDKVQVAFTVDPSTYTPIEYPLGVMRSSNNHHEAVRFYHYLHSDEVLQIFAKYGFAIPKESH